MSLVYSIIPQRKQLLHHLVHFAAHGVVEHYISHKDFAVLDLTSGLHAQVEIHVHVLDVACGVDRNFVPR